MNASYYIVYPVYGRNSITVIENALSVIVPFTEIGIHLLIHSPVLKYQSVEASVLTGHKRCSGSAYAKPRTFYVHFIIHQERKDAYRDGRGRVELRQIRMLLDALLNDEVCTGSAQKFPYIFFGTIGRCKYGDSLPAGGIY